MAGKTRNVARKKVGKTQKIVRLLQSQKDGLRGLGRDGDEVGVGLGMGMGIGMGMGMGMGMGDDVEAHWDARNQ